MPPLPVVLADLLTVVVLGWVGSRLVMAASQSTQGRARQRSLEVVRGLRPRHFVLALPVLVAVALLAAWLVTLPVLSFGWWSAIGGVGNPVVGSSRRLSGPLAWLVPTFFLALLVPALPLLVEREEQIFRRGSEDRSGPQRLARAVTFGLIHAVIGIPLGVALALSVAGAYLTWAYLHGYHRGGPAAALLESTRTHLAYDLVILVLVAAAVAAGGA